MNELQKLISAKHELENQLRELKFAREDLQEKLEQVIAEINKLRIP